MFRPAMTLWAVPLLAASLTTTGACQQAPAAASNTPAARRLAELVRVLNAAQPDTTRAFIASSLGRQFLDRIPADAHAQQLGQMALRTGGLDVHRVESGSPTEASAIARARRTELWRRLFVRVEPEAPHKIVGIGMRLDDDPTTPARKLSDAEVAAQLKAFVERLAKSDDFSGSVMLAKNGQVLYGGAFGEANKDFGVPNRLDTKFNLGSMNKMFTAVAIAQLAERGTLSFEDSLGKWLPAGAMRPEVLAKVRIKHLLSHTSGLGSYFTPRWDSLSRASFRSVDDWLPLVKDETLAFEPGTRWAYSNTGMLVLGKVIERASGQDYFDYVREHIYKPAGMTDTDSYELDRVNRNLAVGYDRRLLPGGGVEWRNNLYRHVIRGGPAGGGYSTVEDLVRFADALRAGKLISPQSVRLLTTPKPELNSPEYGYGFSISDGGKVVGHGGGFPGINSNLGIYLDGGYTVAVMSNYSDGAQPVVMKARSLLRAAMTTASR